MIEQGFYKLSNKEYHYGIGTFAESKSSLAYLLDSARKYRYEKDNPEHLDIFDTKSKKFNEGTAFHTFFLEPEKFDKEISVIPVFQGKGSQAKREEYKQIVRDKSLTPITPELLIMLQDFNKLLHSGEHETAREVIEDPDRFVEMSGFWEDPESGVWLKCRPDLIAGNSFVWDLKKYTTVKNFKDEAYWNHYDLQAYMTLQGLSIITSIEHHSFGFIVFHAQEPPYDIEIIEADDNFINSGQDKFFQCIALLKQCSETDKWPGKYPDEVGLLSPPYRRLQQLINEGKIHE